MRRLSKPKMLSPGERFSVGAMNERGTYPPIYVIFDQLHGAYVEGRFTTLIAASRRCWEMRAEYAMELNDDQA